MRKRFIILIRVNKDNTNCFSFQCNLALSFLQDEGVRGGKREERPSHTRSRQEK